MTAYSYGFCSREDYRFEQPNRLGEEEVSIGAIHRVMFSLSYGRHEALASTARIVTRAVFGSELFVRFDTFTEDMQRTGRFGGIMYDGFMIPSGTMLKVAHQPIMEGFFVEDDFALEWPVPLASEPYALTLY